MRRPGKDLSWKEFFRELYCGWEKNRLEDTAGMLTFSGLLAIFPFLLFAVALASLFIDPGAEAELVGQIRRVVPPAVADILASRLHALATGTSPALVTVGGVGAIWAASGGVSALMRALNVAYGVEEMRPLWKTRGLAVLVTIGAAILVLLASVALLGAPALASLLGGRLSLLIYILRIPVGALFMTLLLAILYYVLPNVRQPFHLVTPGSIAAVVLWLLGSLVFSLYTTSFASYEVAYGALGGVIVLLLWMWISSIAVLLGAEINAVLEPSLQPAEVRQTPSPICPPPTPARVAPAASTEPAAPPSTAESARPPTPRA